MAPVRKQNCHELNASERNEYLNGNGFRRILHTKQIWFEFLANLRVKTQCTPWNTHVWKNLLNVFKTFRYTLVLRVKLNNKKSNPLVALLF